MAAINSSLLAREAASMLVKRKNWAARNVGVMVVFCIVGVVAILLIGLFVNKQMTKRRNAAAQRL